MWKEIVMAGLAEIITIEEAREEIRWRRAMNKINNPKDGKIEKIISRIKNNLDIIKESGKTVIEAFSHEGEHLFSFYITTTDFRDFYTFMDEVRGKDSRGLESLGDIHQKSKKSLLALFEESTKGTFKPTKSKIKPPRRRKGAK